MHSWFSWSSFSYASLFSNSSFRTAFYLLSSSLFFYVSSYMSLSSLYFNLTSWNYSNNLSFVPSYSYSFRFTFIFIDFAVWANLNVEMVSSRNRSSNDTVHTIIILDFPIREFFKIFVNTEFLYGTWITGWQDVFWGFFWEIYDNLLITNDKLERLLLMLTAYFNLWP